MRSVNVHVKELTHQHIWGGGALATVEAFSVELYRSCDTTTTVQWASVCRIQGDHAKTQDKNMYRSHSRVPILNLPDAVLRTSVSPPLTPS